jgi:oxygen-independent coproporphyrinogen-3 oxidase
LAGKIYWNRTFGAQLDGLSRSWNIANNSLYIKAVDGDKLLMRLKFSVSDRYNEYIMTGLRTNWGVFERIKLNLGNPI